MKHQERILDQYHSFEAVKDCFAISRIENEINILNKTYKFNDNSSKMKLKKFEELYSILNKYPKLK